MAPTTMTEYHKSDREPSRDLGIGTAKEDRARGLGKADSSCSSGTLKSVAVSLRSAKTCLFL